jgi:hypothetical protein
MNDEEFDEIRFHIILLFIGAIVIALDLFVWRP